jgi:hypothetical protein
MLAAPPNQGVGSQNAFVRQLPVLGGRSAGARSCTHSLTISIEVADLSAGVNTVSRMSEDSRDGGTDDSRLCLQCFVLVSAPPEDQL